MIPPRLRHLTLGPAKTSAELPRIPGSVETLTLMRWEPSEWVFVDAFFEHGLPPNLRSLTLTDSGRDELIGDLLTHHLPPTLVELKLQSYKNYIGKATITGLCKGLARLPNIKLSLNLRIDSEHELMEVYRLGSGEPMDVVVDLTVDMPPGAEKQTRVPLVIFHVHVPHKLRLCSDFLPALALTLPPALKELNLSLYGPFKVNELAENLFPRLLATLETLKLFETDLTTAHVRPLTILRPPNLRHLDLGGNMLDTAPLPLPPKLQHLVLYGHEMFTSASALDHAVWVRGLPPTMRLVELSCVKQPMHQALATAFLENWHRPRLALLNRPFNRPATPWTQHLRTKFTLLDDDESQEMLDDMLEFTGDASMLDMMTQLPYYVLDELCEFLHGFFSCNRFSLVELARASPTFYEPALYVALRHAKNHKNLTGGPMTSLLAHELAPDQLAVFSEQPNVDVQEGRAPRQHYLIFSLRTSHRTRIDVAADPDLAPAFKWTLLPVPAKQVLHYKISAAQEQPFRSMAAIPLHVRHVTLGPAKTSVELPRIPDSWVFTDTFFEYGLPPYLRALELIDSGRGALVGDLLAHHLPPTLVVKSYQHETIGRSTINGLCEGLLKVLNLKVFHHGKCSAAGVWEAIEQLPWTGMRELALDLLVASRREHMAVHQLIHGVPNDVEQFDLIIDLPPGAEKKTLISLELLQNLVVTRKLRLLLIESTRLPPKPDFLPLMAQMLPPALKELDLSSCGAFRVNELAENLFPLLPASLEKLVLFETELTTAHVRPLTTLWPPNLRHLDLSANMLETLPAPLPPKLQFLGLCGPDMFPSATSADHAPWARSLPPTMRTIEISSLNPVAHREMTTALFEHWHGPRVTLLNRPLNWADSPWTRILRSKFILMDHDQIESTFGDLFEYSGDASVEDMMATIFCQFLRPYSSFGLPTFFEFAFASPVFCGPVMHVALQHTKDRKLLGGSPRAALDSKQLEPGTLGVFSEQPNDVRNGRKPPQHYLALPPRTSRRVRISTSGSSAAPVFRWTLLPVPIRQVQQYKISDKDQDKFGSVVQIPPRVRHLTLGPAKTNADLSWIPDMVETLTLTRWEPSEWTFVDAFFEQALVGDLLAHHLPTTLVELKVRSYNDCIGKAALAGLRTALPRLPNLQVFQLGQCSAIGVNTERRALVQLAKLLPDSVGFLDLNIDTPHGSREHIPSELLKNVPDMQELQMSMPVLDWYYASHLKLGTSVNMLEFTSHQSPPLAEFFATLAPKFPPSMTMLNLLSCPFYDPTQLATDVFPFLPPTLVTLNLYDTELMADHVCPLTKMWPPGLRNLDLGGCDIPAAHAVTAVLYEHWPAATKAGHGLVLRNRQFKWANEPWAYRLRSKFVLLDGDMMSGFADLLERSGEAGTDMLVQPLMIMLGGMGGLGGFGSR
ncbi:hypothetical protein GGF32_001840 [Allomyces javanicus]|nr:hypothetical protein GGF32_001840 [Allomyces javanicus]